MDFQELVRKEVEKANRKHPPHGSVHQSYAIILEELDEFWDEVRKKASKRCRKNMLLELVQIAASAQRAAESHGLLDD